MFEDDGGFMRRETAADSECYESMCDNCCATLSETQRLVINNYGTFCHKGCADDYELFLLDDYEENDELS
jgi:hypothetical protein